MRIFLFQIIYYLETVETREPSFYGSGEAPFSPIGHDNIVMGGFISNCYY